MKYCTVAKSMGRSRPIWTSIVICVRVACALRPVRFLPSRCAERCANDAFLTSFRATLTTNMLTCIGRGLLEQRLLAEGRIAWLKMCGKQRQGKGWQKKHTTEIPNCTGLFSLSNWGGMNDAAELFAVNYSRSPSFFVQTLHKLPPSFPTCQIYHLTKEGHCRQKTLSYHQLRASACLARWKEGGSLCIVCTKNSDMFTNLPSARKTLLNYSRSLLTGERHSFHLKPF